MTDHRHGFTSRDILDEVTQRHHFRADKGQASNKDRHIYQWTGTHYKVDQDSNLYLRLSSEYAEEYLEMPYKETTTTGRKRARAFINTDRPKRDAVLLAKDFLPSALPILDRTVSFRDTDVDPDTSTDYGVLRTRNSHKDIPSFLMPYLVDKETRPSITLDDIPLGDLPDYLTHTVSQTILDTDDHELDPSKAVHITKARIILIPSSNPDSVIHRPFVQKYLEGTPFNIRTTRKDDRVSPRSLLVIRKA